jgi:hypothetical protein
MGKPAPGQEAHEELSRREAQMHFQERSVVCNSSTRQFDKKSNTRQHAAIDACVRSSAHALVERSKHLMRCLTMQLVVALADTK